MSSLQDILYGVSIRSVQGNLLTEPKDLQIDSRKIVSGSCFIAIKGVQADGHQFIEKAVAAGAGSVIAEVLPAELKEGVVYVQVADSSVAAGVMASNFYGQPSSKLKLVGVTGTNG